MTPTRSLRLLTAALVAAGTVLACPPCAAGDDEPSGGRWRLSPPGHLYPTYVADVRRPTCSFEWIAVDDSAIPYAGNTRYGLRVGGRFPVAGFQPAAAPDRGIEIAIDAGFRGLFDADHSLDNIGWDGLYGLHVGWKPSRGRVVYRFAFAHDSSHIGDEYAERPENADRKRIGYTREEWVVGASAPLGRNWRAYGETGWSFVLEDFQEAGRAQVGAEWLPSIGLWSGLARWYAAVDLDSYQEDGWEVNTTLQGGLTFPIEDAARTWRLAATYYDGRSLIGEFYWYEERSLALGLWLDF